MTFAFMGTNFGVINDILIRLGVISDGVAIFTNEPWALIGLVVASVWRFTLFVVVMPLARLQSIPDGYYEAAKMSGANSWQMFKDITLPQLKSIIFIVLLLRGVWMFNKFDIVWILTRGGPGDATRVYSIMAYETAFSEFHLGEASAVSVIGFFLLVGVALVYFKTLRPTEEVTAR
jgi:multiple sugar transport system permease protein